MICIDCHRDTTPCTGRRGCRHDGKWEYFMVRNEIWREAGLPPEAFCCVGCLEYRLERELTAADFIDAPINEPHPYDTPLLAARKAAP